MLQTLAEFLESQKKALVDTQQRLAVVFHVSESRNDLSQFIDELSYSRKLIVSSLIDNALAPERAATKLGEEFDLVVFDARVSLIPNVLGIIAGVLCGGGCLVIILPELQKWKNKSSLFLTHVNQLLVNQPGVYYFKDDRFIPITQKKQALVTTTEHLLPYRTCEQRDAVESLFNGLQKNDQYCCVLTSGRGRGKTAIIGFVSWHLLKKENITLLVTAPKLSIITPLFERIKAQLIKDKADNLHCKQSELLLNNSKLNFIAPDLLLETLPPADVLFVDEAAAIPLSMLEQLLKHYPKIIFSTTTHGYEGSGRGFILKFFKLLDKAAIHWHKIELHQPIRWATADPLEKWIENVLFLNLIVAPVMGEAVELTKSEVKLINRQDLLADKLKLNAIFSLLTFSHYRTSPSDFQYILDDKNVRLYTLEQKNKLLGILVVNQEGDFDKTLSRAIYRGERRPKGNLLAQTLCFHGGCESAAELTYARIMRIVVQPEYQHQGMGQFFLQRVMDVEKGRGIDIIGSSFSVTLPLIRFWKYSGLELLRIGFSRDHVSAAHSVVMAKALTVKGEKVVNYLSDKFHHNIGLWLTGPLSGLDNDLVNYIISNKRMISADKMQISDSGDINSFAFYNRNYEACMPAIMRFLDSVTIQSKEKLEVQEKLIIELSKQFMNNWKIIVSKMGVSVSGQAQAKKLLRQALKKLLSFSDDY